MIIQNKKILILISISIFYIIIISLISSIPQSLAYPSYGDDCVGHHGISIIDIPYDENASIILDGIPSESFWTNPNNSAGIVKIPTVPIVDSPGHNNITINMTIIMNNTYLFIFCEWFDSSTRPPGGVTALDGLFFCWNINVPRFSAYFPITMGTSSMGGGDIDSWVWYYSEIDVHGNQSCYQCNDKCFGPKGFYSEESPNGDVWIGLTYRTDYSYSLEFKRKLITNDGYDVQFYDKNMYKFTVAVINDDTVHNHEISWVYALNMGYVPPTLLKNNNEEEENDEYKPKLNYGFLIIIVTILSISLIILVFYYLNKRTINENLLKKNGETKF